MVFGHLDGKNCTSRDEKQDDRLAHHKSAYAAVSRQWQAYFEPINFERLVVRQSELSYFDQIIDDHRMFDVRALWLRIELPRYGCDSCAKAESKKEASTNNRIFTEALWNLFNILDKWQKRSGAIGTRKLWLKLILSVYSPSDREHHYRSHCFDDDIQGGYTGDYVPHHDPAHHWRRGQQTRPNVETQLRHMGSPLYYDFSRIHPPEARHFPQLKFVRALLTPRQYSRPLSNLHLVIRSLPRLEVLRLETFRDVTGDREWDRAWDFAATLRALPRSLRKFSAFEDSSPALAPPAPVVIAPMSSTLLEATAQRLAEIDASFLVCAEWFFRRFLPSEIDETAQRDFWPRLRALSLTSAQLRVEGAADDRAEVLECAARAALRMPVLGVMEIWHGEEGEVRIFRYTCRKENANDRGKTSTVHVLDSHAVPMELRESVVSEWQAVACKYGNGALKVERTKLSSRDIRSHGSALRWLERRRDIVSAGSARQLAWEARNLRRVLPTPSVPAAPRGIN